MSAMPDPASPAAPAGPSKPPPAQPVDRGWYSVVVIVGLAVVGALGALVVIYGKPVSTSNAQTAAGTLALVTALAVAIERLLEGFWTLADVMLPNPSLPFKKDAQLVSDLATQVSVYVKAPLDQLNDSLKATDATAKQLLLQRPWAQRQVDALQTEITNVFGAVKGGSASRSLTAIQLGLSDLSNALEDNQIAAELKLGVLTLDTLSGWMDTLVSNPGRRIMSLFAGVALGLCGAWLFGLDLVHAALNVAPPTSGLAWGIALTGLAVGLGSNPTHELIKAIQSFKQYRQGAI
jgi:hypothetical protein